MVRYGITLTRLSDPWNDYDELGKEVAELKTLGMEAVVNIIYSVSPRHTDAYYAQKSRQAVALKPYRLCFKDVGGMLTAEPLNRSRARELETFESPDVTLEEVRKRYGGPGLSDEDLLLRYYAGPEFVDALRSAPPRREYLDARKPLVRLVEELVGKRQATHVYIRRDGFTLSAGRSRGDQAQRT
jgi:hypothetical protein